MIWKSWISLLSLLVLTALWSGCVAGPPGEVFKCIDDEIRIGDTLKISLADIPDPEPEKDFVVRSDGSVNMPLLGAIKAAGRKFGELERDIQSAYVTNRMYRYVTVTVKPNERFFSLAGEVKSPGRQVYVGQTTVLRAIASAGDFTEYANRRRVEITRANGTREVMNCKKAQSDPRYDRPICPGDYIMVPRSL
jgi:protein involved in polysaccharide export with SLBB domain